jgi:hypothetical protein
VDQANRILGPFSEALSRKAQQHLEGLGVEVRLGHGIEHIDGNGVIVGGEWIMSKTVIWTAGVAASAAGKWLGAETDRTGRVHIQQNLTIAGYREVFVIGDTASLNQDGKPLPGVAQVAMQQGRYAGKLIHRRVTGRKDMAPFRYFDKGNMAVAGGNFAVLQCRKVQLSGWLGWLGSLPWATIHIAYLAHASLRLGVLVQWALDVPDRAARFGPPRKPPCLAGTGILSDPDVMLASGTIVRWRDSNFAAEQISEMFWVHIAHPYANLKHTDVRIPQQLLCTLDTALNHVLMWGDSSRLFEESRKVIRTHPSSRCKG